MMVNKVLYPCVINKEDNVFYVDFPDFEDAFTDGDTLEEAIINAKDVLSGMIFSYMKNGKELPKATIDYIAKQNERVLFIDLWIDPIFDKIQNQTVKKTLSIPRWLDDAASKEKINFSNILQTALKQELNIIK